MIMVRMKYWWYKAHYDDCVADDSSYDRATKTIMVDVPADYARKALYLSVINKSTADDKNIMNHYACVTEESIMAGDVYMAESSYFSAETYADIVCETERARINALCALRALSEELKYVNEYDVRRIEYDVLDAQDEIERIVTLINDLRDRVETFIEK